MDNLPNLNQVVTKEELQKLVEQNLTISEIAKKLNYTYSKVSHVLKKNNLKTQAKGHTKYKNVNQDWFLDRINNLNNKKEMCDELGIHYNVLKYMMKRCGVLDYYELRKDEIREVHKSYKK